MKRGVKMCTNPFLDRLDSWDFGTKYQMYNPEIRNEASYWFSDVIFRSSRAQIRSTGSNSTWGKVTTMHYA